MGNIVDARLFFDELKRQKKKVYLDQRGIMVRLEDNKQKLLGYIYGVYIKGNKLAIIKICF